MRQKQLLINSKMALGMTKIKAAGSHNKKEVICRDQKK